MAFTKAQIDEIRRKLMVDSAQDSDFPNATLPFKGNETVAIVQNGENRKITLQNLLDRNQEVTITVRCMTPKTGYTVRINNQIRSDGVITVAYGSYLTIQVSAPGYDTKTFNMYAMVTQDVFVYLGFVSSYMGVSPEVLTFDCNGGTKNISISSNVSWVVA